MRPIDLDELMKFPIRLDHYDKENGDEHFAYGVEAVLEYAENLPVVEAEPVRHGRWKCIDEYEEFGEEMADYLCESCWYVISRLKNQKPKFCEGCGARMDGGADNG